MNTTELGEKVAQLVQITKSKQGYLHHYVGDNRQAGVICRGFLKKHNIDTKDLVKDERFFYALLRDQNGSEEDEVVQYNLQS